MPDASVVEQEFVDQIAAILLTSGDYQPYSVATSDVLNEQFRLYRGWPDDNVMVNDLLDGITNISVFSMPGQRNTTRFLRQMMDQVVEVPTPTMTASITGNQIMFIGSGSAKETISVSIGHTAGMAQRLTDASTPQSVANAFSTGLPNASASNGTLTINTNSPLGCVVGMDVRSLQEVHRQIGCWKVTIWAPDPQRRDDFCGLIDPNLQALDRFFFADGSCSGPIVGSGFFVDDVPEKQHLWKRDLQYDLEYPTDATHIYPVMVLGSVVTDQSTTYTGPDMQVGIGISGVGASGL